jgi:phage shock protein A
MRRTKPKAKSPSAELSLRMQQLMQAMDEFRTVKLEVRGMGQLLAALNKLMQEMDVKGHAVSVSKLADELAANTAFLDESATAFSALNTEVRKSSLRLETKIEELAAGVRALTERLLSSAHA